MEVGTERGEETMVAFYLRGLEWKVQADSELLNW